MNNYLEPRHILAILFRWWWVLVLGSVIAIVLGYGISRKQTPIFKATTTVTVGGFIHASQISRDDIIARDAYTEAYADIALRQPILEAVVETLGLNVSWRDLRDSVAVEIVGSTPVIEISALANSPQDAQAIVSEIAHQLILLNDSQENEDATRLFVQEEVQNLQIRIEEGRQKLATLQAQATNTTSQDRLNGIKIEIDTLQRFITDWEDTHSRLLTLLNNSLSQNSLTILEDAHANKKPVSPRLDINLLLSALTGLGLSLAAIFLFDQLGDRIRTVKSLEQELGLNHLGTIYKMKGKKYNGKMISAQNPLFGTALYYRKILKNIGFLEKTRLPVKSLLITSPRLREGKSLTVSNLGIVMAQAGLKTVIVDFDWKKPVQHLLFDLSNETGLMDLLASPDLTAGEHLKATGIPNLQILTTGALPNNPAALLQPERMKKILSDLAKNSNVLILDAPSTTIKESEVLFGLVDGVILVIDSNRTSMTSVKQSMTSLYLTGGKLIGGILNRSPSYWGVS